MNIQLGSKLKDRFDDEYKPCVKAFFEGLPNLGVTDEEMNAVPALFLPGWGGLYESSLFKIAIVGKETLSWANDGGDSLSLDLQAFQNGEFDYEAASRAIDAGKPAVWRNPFWQYAAATLGRLFGDEKNSILTTDSLVLRSIAWFNCHAVETFESGGVNSQRSSHRITGEKMAAIQKLADETGLSDFDRFIKVFNPDVVLYFYRNSGADSTRNFPEGCEFVKPWGVGDAVHEYHFGRTLILQMRHTSWMTRGNMAQDDCAGVIHDILKERGYLSFLQRQVGEKYSMYTMSVPVWRNFVSFVRDEADAHADLDNLALSRHLILVVARELRKTKATMSAQTLVAILNEVDRFRRDRWQYSLERRGPCSSVRGAWNYYTNQGENVDAKAIAESFTTLGGGFAYC